MEQLRYHAKPPNCLIKINGIFAKGADVNLHHGKDHSAKTKVAPFYVLEVTN